MRYIAILLLLGVNLKVNSQQINPVPDYVFRNQMSVGRNAATDSIAYLSVGPKYGAVKGFMPPMVIDTALVTGSAKRNGLLIFSVQKNKFLYWDSVGIKWAEMAGTAGSAVTSTGTANYIPRFATASNLANSAIYQTPGGKIGIGTTTDTTLKLNVNGSVFIKDSLVVVGTNPSARFFIGDGAPNLSLGWAEQTLYHRIRSTGPNNQGFAVELKDNLASWDINEEPKFNFQLKGVNRFTIDTAMVSILTGGIKIGSIDSVATGINVLYADANGVVKKARGPQIIQTSAPSGGTSKPWKLGAAATVTPTSPNRTIEVEIDGVIYYIHAKTTND
jgi:hypothetical protein